MDKIESALKVANDIVVEYMDSEGYEDFVDKVEKIITTRDALLRADERQKAAERAVGHVKTWADAEGYLRAWNIDCSTEQLRAAIMAEPEEGTK